MWQYFPLFGQSPKISVFANGIFSLEALPLAYYAPVFEEVGEAEHQCDTMWAIAKEL
jgi:hypothetical protein